MSNAVPHILTAWTSPDQADWPLKPTREQLAEARSNFEAQRRRRSPSG